MPIVFDPKTDPVYKEGLEKGMQLGLQKGLEQGLYQGLQEGLKKAKLEDAKALIKHLHLSIEDVSKILNIPLEELKEYLYQR